MFTVTDFVLTLMATMVLSGPYILDKSIAQEDDGQLNSNQRQKRMQVRSSQSHSAEGPTYLSVIAQATCTALSPSGFSAAIKRNCGSGLTCAAICGSKTTELKGIIGNQGAKRATCFNALHFYTNHPSVSPTDTGKAHMIMYKYGFAGCYGAYCGPNFCCCML